MLAPYFCSALLAIGIATLVPVAIAADPVSTRVGTTTSTSPATGQANESSRQLAALTSEGRMWGLTTDEMLRARELMRFRNAFTNITLSPVEVLGVHARSDAERKRYAELFARILHDDTVRVLAFNLAHAQAMKQLYPNEPVLDLPKGALPRNFFGAAE